MLCDHRPLSPPLYPTFHHNQHFNSYSEGIFIFYPPTTLPPSPEIRLISRKLQELDRSGGLWEGMGGCVVAAVNNVTEVTVELPMIESLSKILLHKTIHDFSGAKWGLSRERE